MSKWSWSQEALPHQADIGQSSIMARNPMAVLPSLQNDAGGLITITPIDPELDRNIDAIHEAGHCVFAHLLGLHVKNITIKPKTKLASCNLTRISDIKSLLFWDVGRKFYAAGMVVTKKYYPEVVTPPDGYDLKELYWQGGISKSHKKLLRKYFIAPYADTIFVRIISYIRIIFLAFKRTPNSQNPLFH